MNTDFFLPLVASGSVTLLLVGVYKTTFEKNVQAKERVANLMTSAHAVPRDAARQENILKKRKKSGKKDGQKSAMDKLEIALERANLLITPNEFLMMCGGSALIVMFITRMFLGLPLPLAILLGLCGSAFPYLFVIVKGAMRMNKAAAQFADVLDAMVNGFKTGFGFGRAVQMIADNFDDPWGTEFGKMAAEMNLGATQEDVLYNLSNRVPSTDVDLFVTALLIQKETGGSLAELLGNLSKTCRDRYKLFQKVGAISAQGKLSAGIVVCVPFLLCGLMYLFLPDAMTRFITSPIGIIALCLAGFWMCCGIAVLYKIVQIEV